MKQPLFLLTLTLLTLASCTEPITVGADILADDLAKIGEVNDLPFTTRVVRDDSIRVYNADANGSTQNPFSFGLISDPVFGTWSNSFVVTPVLPIGQDTQVIRPEFTTDPDTDVDSIVLILPIDTLFGVYGDNNTFQVRMSILQGPLDTTNNIYSNYPRPAVGRELQSSSRVEISTEATLLYDPIYSARAGRRDTTPHIRLKFDAEFVAAVNALDSTDFNSTTDFRALLPGVLIEATEGTEGIVHILPVPLREGVTPRSGFYFFYDDPTSGDEASFYRVFFGEWAPRYVHDYTGTLAEQLLNQDSASTQTLVAGNASLMTALEFTDIESLRNTLINNAELTYWLDSVAGYDYGRYPAPTIIDLFYRDASDRLLRIDDVRKGRNNQQSVGNLRPLLGGFRNLDGDEAFYRSGFPFHLQGIVNAEFVEPVIYLRVPPFDIRSFLISDGTARAILKGPGAATRPMQADATFTRVQ